MGISVRDLLRKNVEPYEQLGLAEDIFSDDQLIEFMPQHPILINRPIVVTPLGTMFARNAAAEASMVEARGLADAAISPGSDGSCSCVFRTKFRMGYQKDVEKVYQR